MCDSQFPPEAYGFLHSHTLNTGPSDVDNSEFYLVFCHMGEPVNKRTKDDAEAQAKKLAAANPGRRFITMKAEAVFSSGTASVERVALTPPKPTKEKCRIVWRTATRAEVIELAQRMDLVKVFHSVADTSIWYMRTEAENRNRTDYLACTPYARRNELYNYDKPEDGYEVNQAAVDGRAEGAPKKGKHK